LIILIGLLFVCFVLAAFILGLRAGVAALIVVRPLCDRLFESGRFDIAGHAESAGAIMNVIVICTMIFNIAKIQQYTPSPLKNIWFPFLLVCAAAVIYSPVQVDALRTLVTYVCYYAMFALSFVVVRSEDDALSFLKLIVLSSVLPVFYALFQIVSGIDWFLDSRIQSTFNHPNILAFFLLVVIGVILFLLVTKHISITIRVRLLLQLYLVPLLVVLVMTKTRSAWIGCLVLFLAYGLVYDKRVLFLVLVVPFLALALPVVSDRLKDLLSNSEYVGGPAVVLNAYAWRELLWENSFSYIWRQPIFGYGLDSFHFYSPVFFSPTPNGTDAHNVYLQLLFETGLVGLIGFLWIFARCLIWLIRRWQFDWRGTSMAVAVVIAYLICLYSDNLLDYLTFQWSFWSALGAICSLMAWRLSLARSQFVDRPKQNWLQGVRQAPRHALAGQKPRL
jgi:O-antigen ligase